jgi:RHS repeat-associated protein
VAEDRLQSIGKYFPYGEDRYNPTPANPANDQEKFATYTRDSISGLDYAVNRYYAAGLGRFMSADPYAASMSKSVPQSLNRYAYTQNDPLNRSDPSGLCDLYIAGIRMSRYADAEFANAAAEDGAIAVFPYSNSSKNTGGKISGVLQQVAAQAFGSTSATTAAVAGLLLAAQDGDQINVFTFIGGAAAFTAAVDFLNSNGRTDVTNLIGNITYVSPGIAGAPYTNSSTNILLGNDAYDAAATVGASFEGTPVQIAQGCGHDFGCITSRFPALMSTAFGPGCSNPIVINQPPDTSSFWNLFPNNNPDPYDPFAYLNWLLDNQPQPPPERDVHSTIKYDPL